MSSDPDQPSDEAGPLIGWSLGSGLKRRPIDELVSFPCEYTFKVVGAAENDFAQAATTAIAQVLGREVTEPLTKRMSAGGKYESLTFHVLVTSGEEVYAAYAALSALPAVRFVL